MLKMKRTVLLALLFCIASGIAYGKELKLAYIDSDKILEEYADSKEAKQKLQEEEKGFAAQAAALEDVVKKMQDEYASQSLMLSEDARKEREEKLQQKYKELEDFRKEIWGQNGKLYTRNLELTRPVVEKVNAAIAKVSQDESYDFVFDASTGNIVHAAPEYDITERVLELLKKE